MKKSLDALFFALSMENQGEAFFRSSAARVKNSITKTMFQNLADWEVEHQQYIQAQLDSLQGAGKWDAAAAIPSEAAQVGPQTFRARGVDLPKEQSLPVEEKTTELSALRMALFIEEDLYKFYKQAAAHTDDPEGKKVFATLSAWESDHRDILDSRYQVLKEAFFAELGFNPGY